MKRFVRIWGLLAFAIVTILITVTGYFLADTLIENAIEAVGTKAAGAKVELQSADLTLAPLGLTLTGLKVADSNKPMTNIMQVDRIAFLIDGGMILRRKLIIQDMAVEGMAFGTKRSTSGAISRGPAKDSASKDKSGQAKKKKPEEPAEDPLLTLDTPDIDEILKQEDLMTLRLASELEQEISSSRNMWESRYRELPDKKALKSYETRIKKATKGSVSASNIKKRAKELKTIRNDINRDMDNVKKAADGLKKDIHELKKKLKRLKAAPGEDVDRLANKYSLTPEGLGNLSRYFFGGKILAWVEMARSYYEKAEPYIEQYQRRQAEKPEHERGKGINVRFKEHDPKPDFLIERTAALVRLSYGNVGGEIRHITNAQHITGIPTTFAFESDALTGMDSMTFTGTLDHRNPGKGRDDFQFVATGLGISNTVLSSSGSFPVSMESADMDINIYTVISGGNVASMIKAEFSSVTISAGGTDSGMIADTLASALEGVTEFSLTAKLTGTLGTPEMELSSDLDEVLRNAAGRAVKQQAREFRKKLEAEVRARTGADLSRIEGQIGSLDELQKSMDKVKQRLSSSL
ncbi:MAG: TIGR03545 family protein, partial [Thermodesulfovibrionales bacterium]|nr:TIGR03545 family protein [Thermodesulfovibrionales bacterium]